MSIIQEIDDALMGGKPKGYYRITTTDGHTIITIHRPRKPVETVFCLSPGHANQVRQKLTDQGMCGLNGDAL